MRWAASPSHLLYTYPLYPLQIIRTDMRVYIKEELSYTISPSRDYLHITYKNFIYSTFVTIFANILESKVVMNNKTGNGASFLVDNATLVKK